ncbi:MAG: hypothetical protein RLZZ253_3140 [Verrucomicrobiota bacterium]
MASMTAMTDRAPSGTIAHPPFSTRDQSLRDSSAAFGGTGAAAACARALSGRRCTTARTGARKRGARWRWKREDTFMTIFDECRARWAGCNLCEPEGGLRGGDGWEKGVPSEECDKERRVTVAAFRP